MTFLINSAARKATGSTCYFEFQKGKQKNKFWLDNSVYLHADMFEKLMLFSLFSQSVKEFDSFGRNYISKAQWKTIVELSKSNEMWEAFAQELQPWVDDCLSEHKYFTLCGI